MANRTATTSDAQTGQISRQAAEIYDAFFVPALFGPWAGPLCDTVALAKGERALDVACGTGATTRSAARRTGSDGAVAGLDCNPGMLEVARVAAPEIEWVHGHAEAMPFEDNSFDVVLCQFGLMFFEDRAAALGEMRRVVRPGGRIGISVWDKVENSPGYARMIALIESLFGTPAADALRAPFVLGEKERFQDILAAGGLREAAVSTLPGTAQFASIEEWVRMDVRGWTLAEIIDNAGFAELAAAAQKEFADLAASDGSVRFPSPAHIAAYGKP